MIKTIAIRRWALTRLGILTAVLSLVLAMVGALIIQAMNTGILLSGYPPEFNLVVKAAVVLIVLLLQSPRFANAGAVLGRARQ